MTVRMLFDERYKTRDVVASDGRVLLFEKEEIVVQ